jgi:hypothetical protein
MNRDMFSVPRTMVKLIIDFLPVLMLSLFLESKLLIFILVCFAMVIT